MFELSPFLSIDIDNLQFHCNFSVLQVYREDKLKFVTQIKVDQSRCGCEKNKVLIVRQPIFANIDTITFLLVLEWFPNSSKPKHNRKASLNTQKQMTNKFKSKGKVQIQDLISAVFMLSEKIYIEQRYIDEFIGVLSSKQQIEQRQQNCLSIFYQQSKQKGLMNTSSTCAQTTYYYYQNQSNANYHTQSDNLDKSSVLSVKNQYLSPNMNRNSSRMEKSPRNSLARSINQSDDPLKQIKYNIKRVRRHFNLIQHLISDCELKLQLIVFHLNQNNNKMTLTYRFDSIKQLFNHWDSYSNYSKFYTLNKEKAIHIASNQSIKNYREMVDMQLQQLIMPSIEHIFSIIRQLQTKVVGQFIQNTKQYEGEIGFKDSVYNLTKDLNSLEQELIKNYAYVKNQYGRRMVNALQKINYKNNGGDNYKLMKLIGKSQISSLDIGYLMYVKIIKQKLPEAFRQFTTSTSRHRFVFNQNSNNEEDMLNNIENRIDICQQKKKMLEGVIQLNEKEEESLQQFMKGIEKMFLETEEGIKQNTSN